MGIECKMMMTFGGTSERDLRASTNQDLSRLDRMNFGWQIGFQRNATFGSPERGRPARADLLAEFRWWNSYSFDYVS